MERAFSYLFRSTIERAFRKKNICRQRTTAKPSKPRPEPPLMRPEARGCDMWGDPPGKTPLPTTNSGETYRKVVWRPLEEVGLKKVFFFYPEPFWGAWDRKRSRGEPQVPRGIPRSIGRWERVGEVGPSSCYKFQPIRPRFRGHLT